MNIPKAIEILTMCYEGKFNGDLQDHRDALLLSIEALKRLESMREYKADTWTMLLPGETEEVK